MKMEQNKSDLILFQLIQNDSEQAFTIIYKQYAKLLYSFSLKYLKNKEMAEDAVHHVFCKLWEQRSCMDVNVNLKNYLYSATKNYILNEIRNNNLAIQKNYEMAQSAPQHGDNFIEQIEEQELADILQQALNRLPEQKRKVCYYKIYDKLSNQEIAETMNISINTVKTHYSQSIKQLRVMLKKVVFMITLLYLLPQ